MRDPPSLGFGAVWGRKYVRVRTVVWVCLVGAEGLSPWLMDWCRPVGVGTVVALPPWNGLGFVQAVTRRSGRRLAAKRRKRLKGPGGDFFGAEVLFFISPCMVRQNVSPSEKTKTFLDFFAREDPPQTG